MNDQTAHIAEAPRIRPVEASHIADLIRIGEETNLSPWSAQNYLDEMKNPDALLLRLVCPGNTTVGFVVGRFVIGGETEARTDAEIYNIAVVKQEQGKGRGQHLFDAFHEKCLERKVTNIWLEVRESNSQAIAFYRKNGFAHVQTRPSFYQNPREHAYLMKLTLKWGAA
jgi:ribosomal-protein-alanine N-acetyltransferase